MTKELKKLFICMAVMMLSIAFSFTSVNAANKEKQLPILEPNEISREAVLPSNALLLQEGNIYRGSLTDSYPVYWYKIQTTKELKSYSFNISSQNGWVDLYVYDDMEMRVDSATDTVNDSSRNFITTCKLDCNKTYYVRVTRYTVDCSFQFTFTSRIDEPDTMQKARLINPVSATSARLDDNSDQDWYQFKTGDRTYRYEFVTANQEYNCTANYTIYDSKRNAVCSWTTEHSTWTNSASGSSKQRVILKPNSVYYIKVQAGWHGGYSFRANLYNITLNLDKGRTTGKAIFTDVNNANRQEVESYVKVSSRIYKQPTYFEAGITEYTVDNQYKVYEKDIKPYKLYEPIIESLNSKNSKQIKLKWEKLYAVSGYEIMYSTNKKMKSGNATQIVKIKSNSASKTIKKLKPGKTYYFKVRAFVSNKKGEVLYSPWSKVKKIKL